jgi:hypothetical protein
VKPTAKHNHQVSLHAITQSNALGLDALNSHQMMNQSSKMSERDGESPSLVLEIE